MPYHPYFMDEESEYQNKCLAQGDTRCGRDGILVRSSDTKSDSPFTLKTRWHTNVWHTPSISALPFIVPSAHQSITLNSSAVWQSWEAVKFFVEVTDRVFWEVVASPPTFYQINRSILFFDLLWNRLLIEVLEATKTSHSLGLKTSLLGDFFTVF